MPRNLPLRSPFLSRWLRGLGDLLGYPASFSDADVAKLFWLIKLRWLAILMFFALSVPALLTGILYRENVFFYLGLVGILLLFNFLTQMVWSERAKQVSPAVICFQLAFDLLILTALLALTGGFQNPFLPLFFLNACLGGLLIPGRLSWPFLVMIHALLGWLQTSALLESSGTPAWNQIMLQVWISHLLLFGFWLVMRSLGGYFEKQHGIRLRARVMLEKQDRLRAVGALSAGFSHEFATPLNAAKIRLERLGRGSANDPASEIRAALEAIESCEDVVKRMNSAQMDPRHFQPRLVPVKNLLSDIVESWQEDHPGVSIELQAQDIGETKLPPLNFAQVILNLLDNASEAAAGRPVRLTLENRAGEAVLRVEDEGPGFHPLVFEKIGEPFNTSKDSGTGLGLYVSQIFAESLGGSLRVGDRPEGGARVEIRWPLTGGAS